MSRLCRHGACCHFFCHAIASQRHFLRRLFAAYDVFDITICRWRFAEALRVYMKDA